MYEGETISKGRFASTIVSLYFYFITISLYNKFVIKQRFILAIDHKINMQIVQDVKPVKNAIFVQDGNKFTCLHYKSVILEVVDREVTKLYVPSQTSSRMAKRCLASIFGEKYEDKKNWLALKERFNQ